jgi:hypothetical protein
MEYSESKEKKGNLNNPQKFQQEVNQSWITNNFFELTESSSIVIISILTNLTLYEENMNFRNFQLEMHFELTRINCKFLECVLSGLIGEGQKIKMLKCYDFISYEFKRLRNKYEEMSEMLFTVDEENKYVLTIKSLMINDDIKPSKLGCCFLRLVNYYLKKIDKRLKSFHTNNYLTSGEEIEKYLFIVIIINLE